MSLAITSAGIVRSIGMSAPATLYAIAADAHALGGVGLRGVPGEQHSCHRIARAPNTARHLPRSPRHEDELREQ
jgi:hypothetical protein